MRFVGTFLAPSHYQVSTRSLLKYIVKSTVKVLCSGLVPPLIPTPPLWLLEQPMTSTRRLPSDVITTINPFIQRLNVGSFTANQQIGSPCISEIVKVLVTLPLPSPNSLPLRFHSPRLSSIILLNLCLLPLSVPY